MGLGRPILPYQFSWLCLRGTTIGRPLELCTRYDRSPPCRVIEWRGLRHPLVDAVGRLR